MRFIDRLRKSKSPAPGSLFLANTEAWPGYGYQAEAPAPFWMNATQDYLKFEGHWLPRLKERRN